MIEQIKTSCEAETVESSRVLNTMEDLNTALARNLVSAQAASHASNMLIHQVEFLISAVTQFKRNDNSKKLLTTIPIYHGKNA
jgi:methyl-accepting chemotaxis protein